MKVPKLTAMSFPELCRHREAVNAEIVKRATEMRGQLARLEKAGEILRGPQLVMPQLMKAAPKNASRKLPAKYRDPKSGKTWAGRGNQPKWMKGSRAAYLIKSKAA